MNPDNNLTVDFGDCSGDVEIQVDTFDNPLQTRHGSEYPGDSRSLTLNDSIREPRTIMSRFMGMRGKFIRIRIYQEASTTDKMHVMKVFADYHYDDVPSSTAQATRDSDTP